jgi:hypothetical protein
VIVAKVEGSRQLIPPRNGEVARDEVDRRSTDGGVGRYRRAPTIEAFPTVAIATAPSVSLRLPQLYERLYLSKSPSNAHSLEE